MRHLRLAIAVLLVSGSIQLHAQTTSTIVWSHDGEIWRMDDDGDNKIQLSDPGDHASTTKG